MYIMLFTNSNSSADDGRNLVFLAMIDPQK
jgi:hypothetical protein